MRMKLIYPRWPKLKEQTEFHLPPHGPVNFAAVVPRDIELTFVDENRAELDTSDDPDVVGLSVMLTSQIPRAKQIAAAYRERGITVIAGGIGVMLHAEEMAEACDAVFLGEVEGQFEGLLEDLRKGQLKNVYDFMKQVPDIALVGTARRDILDYSLYTYRGVRMVDLVHASRGCRFHCDPCPVGFLGGRQFRPRPIAKVVEEIEAIDNNRLFLVDNSLAQDKDWLRELLTALVPLKRKWISHPIEPDDELLDLSYKAGAWYVYQAILSPSKKIRERVKQYRDHGIGVEGTMILGLDTQDEDDIRRLIDFTLEIELDMAEYNVLTPYPHTIYRTQLEAEGRILHNRWEEYTGDNVVFQPKNVSASKLQDLYHYAWETFYAERGRTMKMAALFRQLVERERADGTAPQRRTRGRKWRDASTPDGA